MKGFLKKIWASPDFTGIVVITVVLFLAGFFYFRHFGVYGDDWSADTFLYHNTLAAAVRDWWSNWGGEVANFRLLAVILPVVWYWAFKILGLPGVFFFIFLIYAAMGGLLYKLLKQSLSAEVALIASLLFLLYPTNNFYLWQVTATYPLSLLFLFGAAWLFRKQRYPWVVLLLIISLLINEGVFFLFAITLLPEQKTAFADFWPRVKTWLAVTLPVFFVYAIIRAVLEVKGVIKGNRVASVATHLNLVSYVLQFFKSFAVVMATSWGFLAWKILHFAQLGDVVIGLAVAVIVALAIFHLQKKSTKDQTSGLQVPAWYLLAFCLILIVAGRYYGFYYVPSINVLNLDSRYYFAASLGGALFYAGVAQYIKQRWPLKSSMVLIILSALMFGFIATAKVSIQRDYSSAWTESKVVWSSLLAQLPNLDAGQAVVLRNPPHQLGRLVDIQEALGDWRFTIPLIYNSASMGYTTAYITNLVYTGKQICITSAPFSRCFGKDEVLFYSINNSAVLPGQNYHFSSAKTWRLPAGLAKALNIN